ncbi:MAG: dynamin family protein [Paracoccaceae bacterium]|nr:dynamin family protein [Paracoccaceae bacterium]
MQIENDMSDESLNEAEIHEMPAPDAGGDAGPAEAEFEVIDTETPAFEQSKYVGAAEEQRQKPRLCLMGEFSAGKSTLSNLLLGKKALPVNVTATQLPPVWISKGDESPYRVAHDGDEFDIDLEHLEAVSVDDTSHIRVFLDADFLDECDLIDMPGISDPNMDAEVWQRVLPIADAIIWCTHATQAWRQSEAAVWATIPRELQEKSFLLLTRMDKILSERDQGRVIKRVARETIGMFRGLYPISLTRALAAGDDDEKWEASGGNAFLDALVELLGELNDGFRAEQAEAAAALAASRVVTPSRIRTRPIDSIRSRRPSRPSSTPLLPGSFE